MREDISMDFIKGLHNSNNKNVIFMVVDWLAKYTHFIGVSHPFIAKKITKLYVENVACLHGIPYIIISDRGALFTSNF
jgi:hypothetical protein